MSVVKNLAFMSGSTAARLAAGILTFTVMARFLGPVSFGVLMYWLSVAALLSLVSNFGLTTYLLREMGAAPGQTSPLMNEMWTSKFILTVLLFIGSGIGMLFIEGTDAKIIFICLLIGMTLETYLDVLNAGFRGVNRYDAEARNATLLVILNLICMVGVLYFWRTPVAGAVAFVTARITGASITFYQVQKLIGRIHLVPLRQGAARIRPAVAYALDAGFQMAFGQVDGVVLNHTLGPAAVGLYQAGLKLFMGGAQGIQILANVFLPRAAAKAHSPQEFAHEARRIQWAFIGFGAVFGLTLAIAAKPLTLLFYGKAFYALADLLPWFGLLFLVRFSASAWGILMTAAGRQKRRVVLTALHWVVIAVAAVVLIPRFGIPGWIMALAIGNAFLAATYFWSVRLQTHNPYTVIGASVLLATTFVPFVWAH